MKTKLKSIKLSNFWKFLFIPVILLFLLGLISAYISFSRGSEIILGGDLYYPLNSQLDTERAPFTWDIRYSTGGTSEARNLPSFALFIFFLFFEKLSLPLVISQKIAILTLFSLTAPAMYYLFFVIYKFQQKNIDFYFFLAAFSGSFFYNFNVWNLFNWAAPSVHLQLSYLATPLVLAFFIQGIKTKRYLYACLIALVFVFISPAASNPIYILNVLWPVVFFIIFFLIKKFFSKDWKSVLKISIFSFVTLLLFLLINSWWILPMINILRNSVATISNDNYFWIWFEQKSSFSSLLNIFRLTSHEAWQHNSPGDLIIASASFYFHNFFLIIITFFLPIIAFIKLLKGKKDFFIFYFFILVISMFFMAKGAHEPFGNINKFLHEKILIFKLYRSIEWYVPMIVLSLSFLIGEGLASVFKWEWGRYKKVLIFVLIAVGFIYSYPFWNGDVVHQGEKTREIANSYFTKIPAWYFESADWINSKKIDFRIISLPSTTSYYHTDWGFSGGELGIFLFNKPIINNIFNIGPSEKLSLPIIKFLSEKDVYQITPISKISSLLNGRFLILRHDGVSWNNAKEEFNEIDLSLITERIYNQDSIYLKEKIGKLDFFKNDDFLPHFYIPRVNIITDKKVEDLPKIISSDIWEDGSAVFFEKQNEGREKILRQAQNDNGKEEGLGSLKAENLESLASPQFSPSDFARATTDRQAGEEELPALEFKKINPTKYRVRVHNAMKNFPLIFSEGFHSGWRVYVTKITSPTPPQSLPPDFAKATTDRQAGEEAAINDVLNDYKILDGNEDDQVNKEELKEFIKNGWVTDLGDGEEKEIKHMKWNPEKQKEELNYVEKYNIDFISKNFQGTIQNDNLPKGKFWETWLARSLDYASSSSADKQDGNNIQDDDSIKNKILKQVQNDKVIELPKENHLMVNGYANSWMVDVDSICEERSLDYARDDNFGEEESSLCVKNEDGAYDMELVVEFWPQRVFYIGVVISLASLLACFGYLGYDFYRIRNKK